MKQKKHYLIYKTTCLLNGRIYIGQHQTYDINDDYLGSGMELKRDIKKFGKENFVREILFDFETEKEMDDKEKELVTEEFTLQENTYNTRVGGQNGCLADLNSKAREKFYFLLKNDMDFRKRYSAKLSEIVKNLRKEHPERYAIPSNNGFWLGKHHSEETKRKIGEKNRMLVCGERNGSFGTVWIYNESLKKNRKVKKDFLDSFLSEGWKLGRKMEFH